MKLRILVTTSSFLDTPGMHVEELEKFEFQLVKSRGPLGESELLTLIEREGPFDGVLAGEDKFTRVVLEQLAPQTKVISRYGVGTDTIDLEAANVFGIKVANTPGVNHTTVAEHLFGLLFSILRHIPEHNALVHAAKWKRFTGMEVAGKTLGIFGFGRVGREVAKRAMAFGMNVLIYNTSWSAPHEEFFQQLLSAFKHPLFCEDSVNGGGPQLSRTNQCEEALAKSDIVSLHMNLTKSNSHFLNARRIAMCKNGVVILNLSRGRLIDQQALANSIRSGKVAAFAADVLDPEPVDPHNPLLGMPYVHLTPHIASRTVDSIVRQGIAAVHNLAAGLANALENEKTQVCS